MDFVINSEVFKIFLLAVFAVLGWISRKLWDAVEDLKDDLISLKDSIHENYVRKDDFREFKESLMEILRRIESKLDSKVDK